VQEPIKILPELISEMMLVVVKQNGLIEMCFLTSVVIKHKSVTLGGSTEHLTTNDGFKVMAHAKYNV